MGILLFICNRLTGRNIDSGFWLIDWFPDWLDCCQKFGTMKILILQSFHVQSLILSFDIFHAWFCVVYSLWWFPLVPFIIFICIIMLGFECPNDDFEMLWYIMFMKIVFYVCQCVFVKNTGNAIFGNIIFIFVFKKMRNVKGLCILFYQPSYMFLVFAQT